MALSLSASIGDVVVLDDGRINIKLSNKSGRQVKMDINAPKDVKIDLMKPYRQARAKGISLKNEEK